VKLTPLVAAATLALAPALLLLRPVGPGFSQPAKKPTPPAAARPEPRRVIIDTDPGADDALAILLALSSPEVRVEAVTVVHGNTTAKQGLANALRLVSLAGRTDVPVAGGASRPLIQKLMTAEYFNGQDGLLDIKLAEPKTKADARFGPDLVIEIVRKHPRQVTLVALGPLTNLALAVAKDPGVVPLVKEVVLMGGSLCGGNATGAAEANVYGDPEAARAVFAAGWPLTMVGLDVCNRTRLTEAHLQRLAKTRGPQNDVAVQILKGLAKFGEGGVTMYDPLAMGAVVDRGVITAQEMRIDVETRGELTRGATVATREVPRLEERDGRLSLVGFKPAAPNVKVAVDVKAERFLELFISRMTGK
jgi:inosine-uridine nucleoside N-ribohydrolase